VQLTVGPSDPALHIRTRDHYQAVLRETKLLILQHDAPPRRLGALGARLEQQFPPSQVEETADRAYRAGEAAFTATVELPDEMVPAAITACDQLEALLDELDRWAADPDVQLLPAPPEVRDYLKRYLHQARQQLHQAHPPSQAVPPA
jgi:hypothetical protein